MRKRTLTILLFLMGLLMMPAWAGEQSEGEQESTCDPETDEACEAEEELERGFDPCLINAKLPACKPAEEQSDPSASERASSDSEDADDSG